MEGYITFEQYTKNLDQLSRNQTNTKEMVLSAPAREGLALLQGLLICGCCGRRLTPRYQGNGGIYPTYQCNWRRREEDKIVQQAVLWVLQSIYEQDILGFSYGYRPGRSQHNALDALSVAIESKKVNWILDADVEGYFDQSSWYPFPQPTLL